ncbi:MAG: EhaD family protein [Methanobrevibacter sp.]|jgi:energy-converting hydrogenase A subunit D|nr:EhaD family protein [Candidatus Methanovirga meridionalis]
MNILDFITLTNISIILMVIGALGIMFLIKPLDKIIMLSILEAGLLGAVVSFKYLDVAFVMALLSPVSIIVFLLALIKINEIRNKEETKIKETKGENSV